MPKSVLSAKHFHDEEAAYAFVRRAFGRNGPVCPHCGGVERISKMEGKSTRIGVYKCYQCRKPFRVTVGTVFEASQSRCISGFRRLRCVIVTRRAFRATSFTAPLGVALKTAWFMSHRIREAMRDGVLAPMGGIVEADETYLWKTCRAEAVDATRAHRPFTKKRQEAVLPTSAPSSRWSSAAARPFLPCRERRQGDRQRHRRREHRQGSPRCIPTKAASMATLTGMVAAHETVKHSAGEYVRYETAT